MFSQNMTETWKKKNTYEKAYNFENSLDFEKKNAAREDSRKFRAEYFKNSNRMVSILIYQPTSF